MDPKSNAKLAGIMKSLGLNPPGETKATTEVEAKPGALSAFVERVTRRKLEPWQRDMIEAAAAEIGAGRATVEVRPLRALSQAELLEAQGFSKLKRPPARRGRVMGTIVDEASFESWGPLEPESIGTRPLSPQTRERIARFMVSPFRDRDSEKPVRVTVLKRGGEVERITDPLKQLGEAALASRGEVIWASPPCVSFSRKGAAPKHDVSKLEPSTKIMILWDDSAGLPRAWATGAAAAIADVQRVAHGNLVAYVAKKNALGEPISTSDFTERLELVASKTNGEG